MMEEYLKKFQPAKPSPGLKDNIFRAVRAELSSIANGRFALIDKIWSNQLFWATATTLLVCLVASNLYHHEVCQKRVAGLYAPKVLETLTVEKDNGKELAGDLIALLGEGNFAVIRKLWEMSLREPTTPTMLEFRNELMEKWFG